MRDRHEVWEEKPLHTWKNQNPVASTQHFWKVDHSKLTIPVAADGRTAQAGLAGAR